MKYFVVLWIALGSGTNLAFADNQNCHFQEVASSYRSEYIWYQVLENIERSLSERMPLARQFEANLSKALSATLEDCGQPDEIYYDFKTLKNIAVVDNQEISFSFFGKDHDLEFRATETGSSFIYRRSNQRGYRTVYFQLNRDTSGKITHLRALGHSANSESVLRVYHYYDSQHQFRGTSPKVPLSYASGELKSLKRIYGKNFQDEVIHEPKVHVGLIGTGIDYNHRKIAKHLPDRMDFEKNLQAIEAAEGLMAEKGFENDGLVSGQLTQLQHEREILGFPVWMDQALNSPRPFDRLIPSIPGRGSQHETQMAGRILQSGGAIALHSVRKAYLTSANEDIPQIFENFHKAGVQVVNLSYSYPCGSKDAFEDQWRQVFEAHPKMIVVAAAGNDGKDLDATPYCPARYSQDYDNVISVTALDNQFQLATYNDLSVNFGATIDLAAVADNLETFSPNGRNVMIKKRGASSMATAEVSRILAEALLKNLPLSTPSLKATLRKASQPYPHLLGLVSSGGSIDQNLFESELSKTISL